MSGVETRVDRMLDELDKLEREVCGDSNVVIAVYMARLSLAFAMSRITGGLTVDEIREATEMIFSEAMKNDLGDALTAANKAKVH